MVTSLVKMKTGETGTVVEIHGGLAAAQRIQSMGIRPGKKIKKIGGHFWYGPQTVKVDSFQVAIGHGMASKILVEVNR